MAGERDLAKLLGDRSTSNGAKAVYTFVTGEWPVLAPEAHATMIEPEGHTYVVTVDDAHRAGAPVDVRGRLAHAPGPRVRSTPSGSPLP